MKHNYSPFNKARIIVIPILFWILGTFLIACGNLLPTAVPPTETPFPTLFVPTPDCGSPTLVLGSSTFQIQTLTRGADGSLTVPSDQSGVAYWVEGTNSDHVFVLSPTPENLAIMPTMTVGSIAKVTWSNCNSTTYSLSAPQQGSFSASALPDQSVEGITVFFQTDPSGASFVFTGELTEEQLSTVNTPETAEVQAEISILETTTSEDKTMIRLGVSILNSGQVALTLSGADVSLTQPDGIPLAMISSEPSLPKQVAPGTVETIYLFFPRPATATATLRILGVEYDIEGY